MLSHPKKNSIIWFHFLGTISIALALILCAIFTANVAMADSFQCSPAVQQTITDAENIVLDGTNALPQIANQSVAESVSAALQNLQQAISSLSTAAGCGTVASTNGIAPISTASQSTPTAQLSINASSMPTAANIGGYGVGYPWTLSIASSLPNAAVTLCAIDNHDAQSCTPGYGSTDGSGKWTLSGSFDPSTIGPWEEWAQLTSDGQTVSSNHINFNVAAFTPLGGPVGTQVTLYGSGFGGANTILMNGLVGTGTQDVSSPNGKTLSFRIPGTLMADCAAGQSCPSFVENVSSPNTYALSVITGGGATQNIGTFSVTGGSESTPPTVTLSINGVTGGGFAETEPWTLAVTSNVPNAAVTLCAIDNHDAQSCTPGYGSTDGSGKWTLSGSFDPSTVGVWQEWAELGTGNQELSSNHLYFTVE